MATLPRSASASARAQVRLSQDVAALAARIAAGAVRADDAAELHRLIRTARELG